MLERTFQEPKFRVCCLGGLKLVETGSGTDMTPAGRKTRALIGYLSIVGKPVGRERLASLLWGDRGDEQARASLRQAIYELRSLLGGNHLIRLERETVTAGDDVGTDVAAILAAAQSGDLEQLAGALREWRGELFEDLSSVDPAFDAWLQSERHSIHESLIQAAAEATKGGIAKGEIDAARRIVGLLQERDNTNEIVLRLGLTLDQLAGDSAALRRRYERFRELLKRELDVAPAAETQRLFQELSDRLARAPSVVPPRYDSDAAAAQVAEGNSHGSAVESALPATKQSGANQSAAAVTSEGPRRWPIRHSHSIRVAAIALATACVGVLAWAVWSSWQTPSPSRQEPVVAVLAFQNLSDDPRSRNVSDGITGEIADALRRTTQIRVALTPSGLRSPGESAPKTLAATHVLSGSIESVGNHIRVIAQLMSIEDDSVVWSHAYDRAIAEKSGLRPDIANEIAGALGRLLSSGSFGEHLNSAAYDHYLKGRRLFLERYPRAATAELETSVRLAPDFANAWSQLAAARWLIATETLAEHREAYDPAMARAARDAAQRALTLDPNNGQAQGVIAMLMPPTRLIDIDRQLERALRSAPNNTQLLGWHGEFLMFVGRNREALNELTSAYVLDPSTPLVAQNLALASLRTGRLEEGKEIIDLIDRGRDTRLHTGFFYLRVKYFLYSQDWFGLATLLGTLPDHLTPREEAFLRLCRETAIAFATHQTGRFGQLGSRWRTETSIDPDDSVQFLSALGDFDGALQVVQTAAGSRQNDKLLTDPEWESLLVANLIALRRDARVPSLLAKWGLSDYWRTSNHPPDFMR